MKSKKTFKHEITLINKHPAKLIRRIALFLYKNSYRPNEKIALLASHVIVIFLVQRAYLTPTYTGLNAYIWLVADSGWGKETLMKAFDTVFGALGEEASHLLDFHVGKPASGQAIDTLACEHQRLLVEVQEAAAWWKDLVSENRPPHIDALYNNMLRLFMATDEGRYWKKRQKATKEEHAEENPFRVAMSFYGESTASNLFAGLSSDDAASGLVQRQLFFIVDKGKYVPPNHYREKMSKELKEDLLDLVYICDELDIEDKTIRVDITDAAEQLLSDYEEKHSKYMFDEKRDRLKAELFNRSALKAYRMASMYAVCDDLENPIITEVHAKCAIKFVSSCDSKLYKKMTSGEVAKGQLRQESDFINYLKRHSKMSVKERARSWKLKTATQRANAELVLKDRTVVPKTKISDYCKRLSAFRNDHRGPVTAHSTIVAHLCKEGKIREIQAEEAAKEYGYPFPLIQFQDH